MLDDERTGAALRTLLDEPAPPPLVTIEQVIRSGRRRHRTQQLGVLSLVIAFVASAGLGIVLLRSWTSAPDHGALDNPLMISVERWPAHLAGWNVITSPGCADNPPTLGPASTNPPRLTKSLTESTFVNAITEATGGPVDLVWSSWEQPSQISVQAQVPVDTKWGTVLFRAMVAPGGPPAKAADADVGVYGTCAAPLRKTLSSGTVLQLFAPDVRSPTAPVQYVRTYRPDGALYVLSSFGWSQADVQTVAGDPGGVVNSGRGRLPLDSQQLADVALRMAVLG